LSPWGRHKTVIPMGLGPVVTRQPHGSWHPTC